MRTEDPAMAAGDSVVPARRHVVSEDPTGRIAGRFARVEPRRRSGRSVLGLPTGPAAQELLDHRNRRPGPRREAVSGATGTDGEPGTPGEERGCGQAGLSAVRGSIGRIIALPLAHACRLPVGVGSDGVVRGAVEVDGRLDGTGLGVGVGEGRYAVDLRAGETVVVSGAEGGGSVGVPAADRVRAVRPGAAVSGWACVGVWAVFAFLIVRTSLFD
ncbi:hypothetical protein [Streptomyces sp. NPDC002265]|uniref:hypothetical protein n=1 Tax=Streptomyces sp. NPDC002265 TaxID=3154415 RepID=UPI003321AF76